MVNVLACLYLYFRLSLGFYSSTASAVQYTAENSLCRFKAIGYSKLPQGKNEDGIIVLLFNKPEADVRYDILFILEQFSNINMLINENLLVLGEIKLS